MDVDVVVVGDGPAGCAAAIGCRAAGLSVVQLAPDALSDTFRPWETLTDDALGLIRILGLDAALRRASRGRTTKLQIEGALRELVFYPARNIDRSCFDAELRARAREQAVNLLKGRLASLTRSVDGLLGELTDGRIVAARWFVDASGRRRVAARQTDHQVVLLSDTMIVRAGMLTLPRGQAQRQNRLIAANWGWIWNSSSYRGRQCWTALQKAHEELRPETEALIARTDPASLRTVSATWDLLNIDSDWPLLAVGDAAGTIDPAAGMGVSNALASGLAAARTIAGFLQGRGGEVEAGVAYQHWIKTRLLSQAQQLAGLYAKQGIFSRWEQPNPS